MTDRSHQPKGPTFCAIDFGTSNSAVALPAPAGQTHLVELEQGSPTPSDFAVETATGLPEVHSSDGVFARALVETSLWSCTT